MTENIVDVGKKHVGEIRVINRELTEKALHMRCLSYLSQVKATLLTETIYEIDESKKALLDTNKELLNQREIIEHQNRLLSEKNKELKAFSHSVSHDLRGSLRRINGFANILLDDYKDQLDEKAADYLTRICSSAHHMAQLIDSLMRLSKISHHELLAQKVNLSELAGKITNQLQKNEPERDVNILIAPDITTQGDKNLLELALQNLLSNAWKFSSPSSPSIIEFGETEIDNKRTFYVRDNGVGFDPQQADKIFNEFTRLHDSEQFKGSGIGLTITYRIIHRHGGEIWAESTEQQGTTFYFRLREDIEKFLTLDSMADS
ncbi:MAG: ATP-binding protein [Gammaproteobacteria bacterium]|jgi:light-regulated signal transduction histidine kinase (bacteriophytochrome)